MPRRRRARAVPLVPLLLYYGALLAVGTALIEFVPGARAAIVAPIGAAPAVQEFEGLLIGKESAATTPMSPPPWPGPLGRAALVLVAVTGALALALPVAWVHMFTRRLRYDPSLVHAIIVLPIVVAGVVLVVKNSLALAFALAGIVAGVRFRQKLDEPQDAVYVLLALGVGLAAGVQALDVALAVSLVYNLVVLVLWRYDLGAIYSGGRGPMLAMGDASVLVGRNSDERTQVRERAAAAGDGMKTDGILVVHAADADAARRVIEVSLGGVAKEWRITDPTASAEGLSRFEVLLRLKKKGDPVALLGELEERWSAQIAAAEYIPFRSGSEEE